MQYTKKTRIELHAKQRAAEEARRAALTDEEAISEILNTVHVESNGMIAAWVNEEKLEIMYLTPAEFVETYKTAPVACCAHCPR